MHTFASLCIACLLLTGRTALFAADLDHGIPDDVQQHPLEASPAGGYAVTNIRFIGNMFSQKYFRCVGSYAVWYPHGNPTDAWNRSGNVVRETGQHVDSGQPAGCF